jgi:prevent-host-death family protein
MGSTWACWSGKMDKFEGVVMDWKIAEAKQRFSEVVRAAEDEPQRIYNRNELVAAVVSAAEIKEFLTWRDRHRRGSKSGPETVGSLRP